MNELGSLILGIGIFILIFIFVLFLAWATTKFIAHAKLGSSKNIEIKETLPVTQGQYLQIIRIGNKYHLIGLSKNNITYCTELEKEELNFDNLPIQTFGDYLKKFKVNVRERQDEK